MLGDPSPGRCPLLHLGWSVLDHLTQPSTVDHSHFTTNLQLEGRGMGRAKIRGRDRVEFGFRGKVGVRVKVGSWILKVTKKLQMSRKMAVIYCAR